MPSVNREPKHSVFVALRPHLLPLSLLFVIFGWMFSRFFIQHLYLSDSDLYEYFLPLFLSRIRLWSSYEFSGLPTFADPGDFAYYPPNLLFGALLHSWTLLVMSAYVMAAIFTYAYVYRLTGSRVAATVSALAYSMSEALLERMAHLGSVHAAAWVPLIALSLDRIRRANPRRWTVIGAFAVASCVLAGHPQPAIYAMYCLGAYALAGLIVERASWQRYVMTGVTFGLGASLAAIKLLPLAEASEYMARQEVNFARFVGRVLDGPQLLSIIFPTIIHGDTRETPTYVGIATLLLAIIAVTRIRHSWRVAFWAMVCVIALLLALGTATPLIDLAYSVPLYNRFRNISRHLFLFAFGLAVLAGYGMDALQRRQIRPGVVARCVALLLAIVAAGAMLVASQPGWFEFETIWGGPGPGPLSVLTIGIWIQIVIAAVAAALVIWMARRGVTPLSTAALVVLLVADLLSALPHNVLPDGVEFTSLSAADIGPSVHAQALASAMAPAAERALVPEGTQTDDVIPAAFARVWRIPIAGGYGPMLIDRYSQFAMMGTNGSVQPSVLGDRDRSLDMLAVRYLLVSDRDEAQPFRKALQSSDRWRAATEFSTSRTTDRGADTNADGEEHISVFENTRRLPRAWIVGATLSVSDRDALRAIHESTLPDGSPFDPAQLALVPEDSASSRTVYPSGSGTARVISVGDGDISVTATANADAYLVLAEGYYPGWTATVDGVDTPVRRSNLTLQGIVVPAGTHRVDFRLRSKTRRTGTAVSLAALVVGAGLLVTGRRTPP